MEAFVLAAGLGSRLRPLTNDRPKAMVQVGGCTLLERTLRTLMALGATRIVVNVHHFADMIEQFIDEHQWDCPVLVSDERSLLLDTGGGLKHAQSLFSGNEPILIHNVDILSRISLRQMLSYHQSTNALSTLAVSQRSTSRQLLFNPNGELRGWVNQQSGDQLLVSGADITQLTPLAFSGIAVISPELLPLLPDAQGPYPIVPQYLRLAEDHRVNGFVHQASDWMDVGKPETLRLAEQFLS